MARASHIYVGMQDQTIAKALRDSKRVLVVGLSPDPGRASFGVTQYMIRAGFQIAGVRPGSERILDRPVYASIAEAIAAEGPFDLIDVFRAPEHVAGLVDEILGLAASDRPRVLWLQEGVTDPAAERRATAAGIVVISDLCVLKEHRRLIA